LNNAHRLLGAICHTASPLDKEGVEHANVREERIDTTDPVPTKYVDIRQVLIENPVAVYAGVVQMHSNIVDTIDDVLPKQREPRLTAVALLLARSVLAS
jgi:hypothetical protein